jgi:hypothetical protein
MEEAGIREQPEHDHVGLRAPPSDLSFQSTR